MVKFDMMGWIDTARQPALWLFELGLRSSSIPFSFLTDAGLVECAERLEFCCEATKFV